MFYVIFCLGGSVIVVVNDDSRYFVVYSVVFGCVCVCCFYLKLVIWLMVWKVLE